MNLRSPVPVLTLKGDLSGMGKKILVPLDLTRETWKQLCSAVAYGKNYDASIVLVSAMIAGMEKEQSLIYKKLTRAKKFMEENGVDCKMKLFEHSKIPPYNRVLDYAEEIKADMILVMTHEEGYTHDNYIGAFARTGFISFPCKDQKTPVLPACAVPDGCIHLLHHKDAGSVRNPADPGSEALDSRHRSRSGIHTVRTEYDGCPVDFRDRCARVPVCTGLHEELQ